MAGYGYQYGANPSAYTYYDAYYGGSTYSSTYAFYNGQITYSAYANPSTGYYFNHYDTSYGAGDYQSASGYTSGYAVYENLHGYSIKGVEAYAVVYSVSANYGSSYYATFYEFPGRGGYAIYKTVDYYSPGSGEYATHSYIPSGYGLKA